MSSSHRAERGHSTSLGKLDQLPTEICTEILSYLGYKDILPEFEQRFPQEVGLWTVHFRGASDYKTLLTRASDPNYTESQIQSQKARTVVFHKSANDKLLDQLDSLHQKLAIKQNSVHHFYPKALEIVITDTASTEIYDNRWSPQDIKLDIFLPAEHASVDTSSQDHFSQYADRDNQIRKFTEAQRRVLSKFKLRSLTTYGTYSLSGKTSCYDPEVKSLIDVFPSIVLTHYVQKPIIGPDYDKHCHCPLSDLKPKAIQWAPASIRPVWLVCSFNLGTHYSSYNKEAIPTLVLSGYSDEEIRGIGKVPHRVIAARSPQSNELCQIFGTSGLPPLQS